MIYFFKYFIVYEKAREIVNILQESDNNFDLSVDPNGELENNILVAGVFVNAGLEEITKAHSIDSCDIVQLH
jgi:phosphoribosylanthranilate isomerase